MIPRQKGNSNKTSPRASGSGAYQQHGHGHLKDPRGQGPSIGIAGIPVSFRGDPDGAAAAPSHLDPATLQLNGINIRNTDPEFVSILEYSTQSAVYPHQADTGGYGQARAVGSLFIYKRISGDIGFIVMNRVGVEHWLYAIKPNQIEVQLSKSYLLFNHIGDIFCIWFYSAADAARIFKFLKSLGIGLNGSAPTTNGNSGGGGGQMLMNWLKTAEESKTGVRNESPPPVQVQAQANNQRQTPTIYHPKPLNPARAPSNPTSVLDAFVSSLNCGPGPAPIPALFEPAHGHANVMQTVEQIEAQSTPFEQKHEPEVHHQNHHHHGFMSEMKQIEAQLKLTLKISESGPEASGSGCQNLLQSIASGSNGPNSGLLPLPIFSPPQPTASSVQNYTHHHNEDLSRQLQDAILHALPPMNTNTQNHYQPQSLPFQFPSNLTYPQSPAPISRMAFGNYLRQLVGTEDFVDQIYQMYLTKSNCYN